MLFSRFLLWPRVSFATFDGPLKRHTLFRPHESVVPRREFHPSSSLATPKAKESSKPRPRFTAEEDRTITELRKQRIKWPGIQRALPHRSIGSIQGRWRTHLCPPEERFQHTPQQSYAKFTEAEDRLITKLRSNNLGWVEVQLELPHRTRGALYTRWSDYIRPRLGSAASPSRLSNGRTVKNFSSAEDAKILSLKAKGGKWREIAEGFPDRHADNLKVHHYHMKLKEAYHDSTRDTGKFEPAWSDEEESLLLRLRGEEGRKWADVVSHFPTRRWYNVRNHYRKIGQWDLKGKVDYTPAETETLFRLKAANQSWAQIANVLPGRSIASVSQRYKYCLDTGKVQAERQGAQEGTPDGAELQEGQAMPFAVDP